MPEETEAAPPEQGGDDVPKEGVENKKDVEQGTQKPTAIEVAEKLADRIDAGNKKAEDLIVRQEKLHAEQMLGGSSDAGQAPPEKKELTDEEYKDKILAGEKPE